MDHHELAAWRRERLALLAQEIGNNVMLGKALGHPSGQLIAHMIAGRRSITTRTIEAIEALPRRAGWFTLRDVVVDDEPATFQECLRSLDERLSKMCPTRREEAQIALRHFVDTLGSAEYVGMKLAWLEEQGDSEALSRDLNPEDALPDVALRPTSPT